MSETVSLQNTSGGKEKLKAKKRVLATITIASKCGQAITYDEIALMLPKMSTSINIKNFMQTDSEILEQITIKNNLITLKGYEHLFNESPHRELVSKQKFRNAIIFANSLLSSKSHLKLLAVCGSVAYGAATDDDDIDFFLIAQKNRMWLTFAKSLLLARIINSDKTVDKKPPNFCLSYVQDEKNFAHEAASHRDLLFARELLSAKVLAGSNFYYSMLDDIEWIKNTLPAFYNSKLSNKNGVYSINEPYYRSGLLDISNTVIYVLLGNYLRFKAFLKNLSFKKKGQFKDLFEAKITKGSCIYNSERYKALEKMYAFI